MIKCDENEALLSSFLEDFCFSHILQSNTNGIKYTKCFNINFRRSLNCLQHHANIAKLNQRFNMILYENVLTLLMRCVTCDSPKMTTKPLSVVTKAVHTCQGHINCQIYAGIYRP